MKRIKEYGLMTFCAIFLSFMLCSFTSFAQSAGKVTASSAKIRSEATASSDVLASVVSGDSLTIQGKVKASDGYTWYQVFVNANTLGYIRSDLVSITDGTTPADISSSTNAQQSDNQAASTTTNDTQTNTDTTASTNTVKPVAPTVAANVEKVNPASANVSGGQSIRVRSVASTKGEIVTSVAKGSALTVVGKTTGDDSKTWYQISYIENGNEISGFIRSDFVTLSEELTPYVENVVTEEEPEVIPEEVVEQENNEWSAKYDNEWYLVDNVNSQRYKINDIFSAVENNKMMYENEHNKAKQQEIIIIGLVIFLVLLVGVVFILILKMKDIKDEAYFAKASADANRRRNMDKTSNRRPAGEANRARTPEGQRPVSPKRPENRGGQNAVANDKKQVQRVAQPAGNRPAQPTGNRTAQPTGNRPAQPTGNRVAQPSNRNTAQPVTKSNAERTYSESPKANSEQVKRPAPSEDGWKPKNFLSDDDDDFEFDFLNNWDDDIK